MEGLRSRNKISCKSSSLNVDHEIAFHKAFLRIYQWFRISEFGEQADQDAWLIVQNADQEHDFQKQVLILLEDLWRKGETKPRNYAFLFDRVAASWNYPSKRVPQRYGTQGICIEPGVWEPIPIEDPEHLDSRRAEVGLGTMAEQLIQMKGVCH